MIRRTLLALLLVLSALAHATDVSVPAGSSVQAAIDAAHDGDVLHLAAGTFDGDLDFRGKAIAVTGAGPTTVLRGSGTASVVRFATGETAASLLADLTVTGGLADAGGGIHVDGASPTIRRVVVTRNVARREGSGIFLRHGAARVENSLVTYNRTADPSAEETHSVEIVEASPVLLNNTIAYGDGNGIILRGASPAVIRNNVLAYNGLRLDGDVRGRGICDFSGATAVIQYNLFFRNRKAAILTGGLGDFKRITRAQLAIGGTRVAGNTDVSPRFVNVRAGDFRLRAPSRARHMGDPSGEFANRDGSRNDIGFTGGPLAP